MEDLGSVVRSLVVESAPREKHPHRKVEESLCSESGSLGPQLAGWGGESGQLRAVHLSRHKWPGGSWQDRAAVGWMEDLGSVVRSLVVERAPQEVLHPSSLLLYYSQD